MSRKYSNAEIDFIRQNYHNMSNKAIGNHLKRSETGVRKLASNLGLKKSDEYISKVKSSVGSIRFVVFQDHRQIFEGIGKDVAAYCGCAASSVSYAAQRGAMLKSRYMVAYADDASRISEIMKSAVHNTTDAMYWPLWFFKAGLAPMYAHKYQPKPCRSME